LRYYKGSHVRALIEIYRDLKFIKQKLCLKGKWQDPQKRRQFFDEFAASQLFNPLDTEKWYSIRRKDFADAGGESLLQNYFKGSFIEALIQVYPQLNFQKDQFVNWRRGSWKDPQLRRKFFDEFAASKKFNPLDAKMWYCFSSTEIRRAGGRGILGYYGDSLLTALRHLYREVKFRK